MSFCPCPAPCVPILPRSNGVPHAARQPGVSGRRRSLRVAVSIPGKRSRRAYFIRGIGLVVYLLAGFVPTAAQTGAAAPPRLIVETPEIDLGAVSRGEIVHADYVLRNAGGRLLTLRAVEPG